MSRQANVQSIDALRQFRAALIEYAETVSDITANLHVESRHTIDWMVNDRATYWPAQVRQSSEDLVEARTILQSKQVTINGRDRLPCTEEKQALAAARRRHRYTEEKVRQTKKLLPIVKHQGEEYRGTLGRLSQLAETDLPAAIAILDRLITSLEKYAQIRVTGAQSADSVASAARPKRGPSSATDATDSGEAT